MEYKYNVLKRVRQLEEKKGIKYAKTDGRLYVTLKFLYTIIFAYTLIINFLAAAGPAVRLLVNQYTKNNVDNVRNLIVTIIVASVFLIVGRFIIRFREQIWANITFMAVNLLSCVFLLFTFAKELKDGIGFLGYNFSFYWRHAVPLLLLAVLAVWLTVIAVRANIKTDKQYKKVIENIYAQYTLLAENEKLSEEKWEEFLENYNC